MYPAGYGENPKVPLSFVVLASQKSGMVLHFLCFYGHPTLSAWFASKSQEERQEARHGSVTDCGANGRAFQGCVRFKKLEDLPLDVVGRTVARVSAEEHMANYRAARALMGKGRNAGEGAAGLSRNGLRSQTAGLGKPGRSSSATAKGSAKQGAEKSAVKKAKPKN